MARLPNKGTTQRAPQTGASVPELPDFSPQLAELPGGQETNAALQRWWDLVRQRIEFNNGDVNSRFSKISATFNGSNASLQAQITNEETVRASADEALASSIEVVSAEVDGLVASVTTISTALATVNNYLEARWTVNVTAGPIVTGMTLFSASGPDTDVSYVAFQADRFQINTSTGGNKLIFSGTGSAVKLGDVLTVDLANAKMFIGTGTFNNNNTGFYVDSAGNFSLKSFFSFNAGTNTLSIATSAGSTGGWTINPTTLTGGNATLNSAGVLTLGTANDIVYISAVDATYRLWVGNVTAATATFSVTKTGALFSTAGTIAGWTIGTTTISKNNAVLDSAGQLILGTSNDIVYISATDATYRIWIGNVTAGSASFRVTKTGTMTAVNGVFSGTIVSTNGVIGGYVISAGSLTAGSGPTTIDLSNSAATGLTLGDPTAQRVLLRKSIGGTPALFLFNASNLISATLAVDVATGCGSLLLSDATGSPIILLDASTGTVSATLFSGSGASLTTLNASNLSSGTLANARLPSAISVASLALTSSLTMTNGNNAFDQTNGTVTMRSIVNNSTSRVNWGTISNHSIEIFTNNTSIWFFGSDGHLKAQSGKQIRTLAGTGWTVPLYDDTNTLEFRASGGQIFGRINGGGSILLG